MVHLPMFNKIQYVWMFMNATVVHYNNGIWGRERLHVIKGALNEFVKAGGIKCTFKNIAVKNSFFERQCWKNRVSN